jgi:hypothetical protein
VLGRLQYFQLSVGGCLTLRRSGFRAEVGVVIWAEDLNKCGCGGKLLIRSMDEEFFIQQRCGGVR